MLRVASVCTPCCMLLRIAAQSLKPVKLFSQQLPTFLLFRDRRSVAQQCWIRLYSSSNIIGTTHAHYAWFTKTYGWYPSHDALQVPTLLGVVASVYTPLPTCTQQLPTLFRRNNVGSYCVRLQVALYCLSHPVIQNSLWHRSLASTCRGSQLFSFLAVWGNYSCNPFYRWFSWARTIVCRDAFVLLKISSQSVFDDVWWPILIYGNTREFHVSVISNLQIKQNKNLSKNWILSILQP